MSGPLFGFMPGRTAVHRIDPLSKLLIVLLCSVLVFVTTDLVVIGVQLGVLVLAAVLGRPRTAPILRPLLVIAVLAALLVVFQTTSVHTGTRVLQIGPVGVTTDGVDRGRLFALRVATLMLASFVFVRTSDPRRLVVGLVRLGVPYRYAWTVFIALTSLAMLRSEFEVAREAQLVRGLPPSLGPARRQIQLWRRYAQSMLVIGLRRVEVVSVAMDLRGFGASRRRTFVDPYRWSVVGIALAVLWVATILLVVLR